MQIILNHSTLTERIKFNTESWIRNYYKKFSSPVHNNSNKHRASTVHTTFYDYYERPIELHNKTDFKPLYLRTFNPTKLKRSQDLSLSKDTLKNELDYQ